MQRRQAGGPLHDPARHGPHVSRRRSSRRNGPARVHGDCSSRQAWLRTSAGQQTPRGDSAKRSVRIYPRASQRRPRHRRHQPKSEIPIVINLWPAGSFLGDFRTPAGARNSSRKRTGSLQAPTSELLPLSLGSDDGSCRPHCRRSERRVRRPKPAVHSLPPDGKSGTSAEEVIREIKRLLKIEKNPPTVTRAEGRLTRRGGFLKSTASSPTTITAHNGCGSL